MPTMQTAQPLRRIPANAGTESVYQVAKLARERLILDPPYQRGSVWGATRRRNLIMSLLSGVPVSDVFIAYRDDYTEVVIDGKQRIETILAFYDDELSVPASWFPADLVIATEDTEDGPYVRYSGLADLGKRYFDRTTLTTQRLSDLSLDQEKALFDLVNYGGLAQGQSDL